MMPIIKETEDSDASARRTKRVITKQFRYSEVPSQAKNHKSIEKIKVPRSLILHKKNKSNDCTHSCQFDLPSVEQILARILEKSESPVKIKTESRTEEVLLPLPRIQPSISPRKISLSKKKQYQQKNHFRSLSPLKPFNDRIFHLKRIIGK